MVTHLPNISYYSPRRSYNNKGTTSWKVVLFLSKEIPSALLDRPAREYPIVYLGSNKIGKKVYERNCLQRGNETT